MRRRRRVKRKGGGRHVGIRDGPGYLRKCSDSPPSRDGKGREPAMASYSYGMCSVLCACQRANWTNWTNSIGRAVADLVEDSRNAGGRREEGRGMWALALASAPAKSERWRDGQILGDLTGPLTGGSG